MELEAKKKQEFRNRMKALAQKSSKEKVIFIIIISINF